MVNQLEARLWPALKRLEPKSQLGGIYANKRGYHNKRQNLPATDYSVGQFAVDRQGPADEACAIDWTFPDAQRGDYSTIGKYSRRLLAAGKAGDADPRTRYWREFFGNTDDDREVEGWDFTKNRASTSDTSHLWHIHLSEHRGYVESVVAAEAMISILEGESVAAWTARTKRKVALVEISGKLPEIKRGDTDPVNESNTYWIKRAQRQLEITPDGDYGPGTAAAVKAMMADDAGRSSKDGSIISLPEWRRLYGIW